jgi:hypothetical protein
MGVEAQLAFETIYFGLKPIFERHDWHVPRDYAQRTPIYARAMHLLFDELGWQLSESSPPLDSVYFERDDGWQPLQFVDAALPGACRPFAATADNDALRLWHESDRVQLWRCAPPLRYVQYELLSALMFSSPDYVEQERLKAEFFLRWM